MIPVASTSPLLVFVALLATSIWVGGFVAIVVVARVARDQLDQRTRVSFFRALGRAYGVVGCAALAVALASGVALLSSREWDAAALVAVLVAAALVAATAAGIVQARGMTRLRRDAAESGDPEVEARVRRGAARAAALRATIGVLSIALLALAAALAT